MTLPKFTKKQFIKWLRILHRDLGYFVVGISLVYALSGIILNHRGKGNPSYSTKSYTEIFPQNLNSNEFRAYWTKEKNDIQIKKIIPSNDLIKFYLKGGKGEYETQTGNVIFEVYKKKPFVAFINRLHFNRKKGWVIFADFFAFSLIFFAISGLFMVQGKNSFRRRGIWIMLIGIGVVIAFYFV